MIWQNKCLFLSVDLIARMQDLLVDNSALNQEASQ